MKSSLPGRPPTFLWQAALVTLPVGLLTLAGFWALRQDRRLVEQDARDRSEEVLRTIRADLETSFLSSWGEAGTTDRREGHASSPASGARPLHCQWDHRGRLVQPTAYADPPSPPDWFGSLTPDQRAAWHRFVHDLKETGAGKDPELRIEALVQTSPPESGARVAEFLVLQTEAALGEQRSDALLPFAQAHPTLTSPSGLPLIAIATATLLATEGDLSSQTSQVLDGLQACVLDEPSIFTSWLLERAFLNREHLSSGAREKLDSLQRLWAEQTLSRQLAHTLTIEAATRVSKGVLWLRENDHDWLAVFGPEDPVASEGDIEVETSEARRSVELGRSAWFIPRQAMEAVLSRVLESNATLCPPYTRLQVTVATRQLRLPSPLSIAPKSEPTTSVLATTHAEIQGVAVPEPEPGAASLPAPIPIGLALHLIDPELLYARQTQRMWLLGSLMLVAALAAMAGLAGAYRSFHRQLRLAEMKSSFISSVSHELRAPIASVRLLAESLERGTVSAEPKRQEYFRLIGQQCRRLTGLIENVLDFSRIDQGRKQYAFEPTDMGALIRETVRLMETYAQEQEVSLALSALPDTVLWEVAADGRALQQALVNLIDNAIKHSPAGQSVRVSLSQSPDCYRLSVADRGPGIPAEDRERIFDPFYRRGSELRRETEGVGIGLSIVRHVAEAHRGRVILTGHPGHGSTFTLEIPRSDTPPEP